MEESMWQQSDLSARSVIAEEQLREYQEAAQTWPVKETMRRDNQHRPRWCSVCRECDQSLWFTRDGKGVPYEYTGEEKLALIVAHIRQCHPTMEVSTDGNGHE